MTSYDLYIGNLEDAGDREKLSQNDISVILSLTKSVPRNGYPIRTYVVDYPLAEPPTVNRVTFMEAVDHLAILLMEGETVLVHSADGGSSSGVVAAAAVSMIEDIPFDDALDGVRRCTDGFDPHPSLVESGRETVNELKYIAN